jgi:predicted DCC family thiol-disulfide oxidoreductase YuxK
MSEAPLTVYYDGLCPICSREMEFYRRLVRAGSVHFVDITDPAFDAPRHGLDAQRIHQVLHVKQEDTVHTGVTAFLALWGVVPGFRWLTRLARLPVVYSLLTAGYHTFAVVRRWLPRLRRADCVSSACRR